MSLEIFTGDHLPALLTRIRESLGPDACVVQLRRKENLFELIASDGAGSPGLPANLAASRAAAGPDFRDIFRAEAPAIDRQPVVDLPRSCWAAPPRSDVAVAGDLLPTALPLSAPIPRPGYMVRPWVVALVGPTGAGKTTTIAKLATNPLAFGGSRVGLIGLDTYRVGAVEQLETYADIAALPIEIAYSDAEVSRALGRLDDCEVVLVDTPGRGPRNTADAETIRRWFTMLAPDEVHLTLPAGQLPAVTRRLLRAYESFGVTHLLATKLDEYPAELAIFTIAHEHSRRMRWVTDGQEVPADLQPAEELLASRRDHRDHATSLESVA